MSVANLTDQQRGALDVAGASVALVAGAGCGKTTVLTERFLRHLEDRPLSDLVALTFTEKAARELRERVRAACRRRLDLGGDDAAKWRGVLRGLEVAPIGTFHGFCGRLLRRFPVEAGATPGFGILEESIAPGLRDAALAGCIRGWLAESDPDLVALAVDFGLGTVREWLSDLVAGRSREDLAEWSGVESSEAVARWRDLWEREFRPALLREFVEDAAPCLELLAGHECSHKVMKERQAFLLSSVGNLPTDRDPAGLLEQIGEHARVQGGGTKAHWPTPDVFEAVKKHLTDLRDGAKKAGAALAWDEAASLLAAEHGARLARLAVGALDAYDREKRAAGMLDFDDLLLKARDLLRNRAEAVGGVAAELAGALLVDEFQDTDPVQGEILEHLAGPGFGDGSLFLVGDPKQSIYRFRGARPGIFEDFRNRFPAHGHRDLTENFRSVPGILGFVNALFAEEYPGADLAAANDAPPGAAAQPVTFLWADEPVPDGADAPSAHARRVIEARWIARHLAGEIGRGDWIVRDPKTQAPRPAHGGDVALLFRALTDVGPYEKALADEGLDYHVVGGSAYFVQQEVIDLINLASVVEDPTDATALAATLRSPFFGVSDDGLYWLATAGNGDLARSVERWPEIGALPTADRPKVARAHAQLTAWRAAKDRPPMAAWLDRVLAESGYEAALLGEYLGGRKRANVRKLVRMARRFDGQGGMTLADFVARLRADRRRPPREEQAATTEEEGTSVRLMSIHQAKGLEFPIVVLPDLDRKPAGERSGVAFHPDLGPLVRPPVPDDSDTAPESLGWSIARQVEAREEAGEALRLFYVATTRARDALILSAGVAADAKHASPAMKLLAGRFDLAGGRAVDAGVEVEVIATPPPEVDATPIADRIWPRVDAILEAIEDTGPAIEPDEESGNRGRPTLVDLDPARGLVPTESRVDRLVRAVLADPRVLEFGPLGAAIDREGRRQSPAASRRVRAEARARLDAWLASPLARRVAAAAEVIHDLPWSVAWPPEAEDATVYLGRVDLAFREESGVWHVIALADPEADVANERLRVALSAYAAESLEFGPVDRGWTVQIGPEGAVVEEVAIDPYSVEVADG